MVSGVWNQLLLLGNRIDGFVRAGESASALPTARLALNLLQHACPDDRPGLDVSEADRLRALLADRETQEGALRQLIALTRNAESSSSVLPPLWRSESLLASRARKRLWTWREKLGVALFRALRYRHTRYSPTGQAGVLYFRAAFDPRYGVLRSVQPTERKPDTAPLKVSDEMEYAFFVYSHDLRRFYLSGYGPERLVVQGLDRHAEGERRPDLSGQPSEIRFLLESIHGSEPVLPRTTMRRRRTDGGVIHEIDPSLHESNARYARKVLPSPEGAVMGVTMLWTESMTRAAQSGSREELERLMPVPVIFVSVAHNGAFAGFVYQMPERNSPRGTVYEIGSPEIGTQARLLYEIYTSGRPSAEDVRIPVGVRWMARPNRHQKRAIERWIQREEFGVIRDSWTLISKSD
ncbi:MAG TPA: hypothetical protein VLJ37_06730 [bacterium]|nr:hypothetical protein [bacterium]